MMATWFQGPAGEFIRVSREGFEGGVRILHFLGGTSVDVRGDRAIAQTKMTITQRAPVHDVVCDVVCTGRFYDFLERRDGRWGIVLRQPIYEQDRLNSVDPAAKLSLDAGLLERFPIGYRHLAYLQTQIGFAVKPDMPGLTGEAVDALYARGAVWLSLELVSMRTGCGSSARNTGRASGSICHSPAAPAPAEISLAVSSKAGTMRSENSSIETRCAAAEQLIAAIVPE